MTKNALKTKVLLLNFGSIAMILFGLVTISAQSANAEFCWKGSNGRGVGKVPGYCSPNLEKLGLLCYEKCKPDFYKVALTCWQKCPPGFPDSGATFCKKPSGYDRGTLWFSHSNCNNANKQVGGCEWSWGAWYPKCKANFHVTSATRCEANCPTGFTDTPLTCEKQRYTPPPITPDCNPGQVKDAGLCYPPCGAKQYGVGPVCYNRCPAGLVPCGISEESSAACASSAAECATKIGEMIVAVGSVIYKIADTVLTGGGFSNLTQIAKDAAIDGLKKAAKSVAKESAKMSLRQVKELIREKNPDMPPAAVDAIANMQKNPDGYDYVNFLTKVDPTGLAAVAASFMHGICSE